MNRRIKKVFFGGLAFLLLSACLPGHAFARCDVSTTGINFNGYDVASAIPTDSTGTITVTCNEAPPPIVTISVGPSPNSGVFVPRKMKNTLSSDTLSYNLFINSSMSVVWGDGTQGTSTASNKVTKNKSWISTVYGRLFPRQDVHVGPYNDSLLVTITW